MKPHHFSSCVRVFILFFVVVIFSGVLHHTVSAQEPEKAIDAILLIDSSQSTKEDEEDIRLKAAYFFIDQLRAHQKINGVAHKVGVIGFNNENPFPFSNELQPVENFASIEIEDISRGRTDFNQAIDEAVTQLNGSTAANKIILLFTDGSPDNDPVSIGEMDDDELLTYFETYFSDTETLVKEMENEDIRLYVLDTSGNTREFWGEKKLKLQEDKQYHYVSDINQLLPFYQKILTELLGENTEKILLNVDDTIYEEIEVLPYREAIKFSLINEIPGTMVRVVPPDDRPIEPDFSGDFSGGGDGQPLYEIYNVSQPQTGTWRVIIQNGRAALWVEQTAPTLNVEIVDPVIYPDDMQTIVAYLDYGGEKITDLSVEVTLVNDETSSEQNELMEDVDQDGVYEWKSAIPNIGSYTIYVTAFLDDVLVAETENNHTFSVSPPLAPTNTPPPTPTHTPAPTPVPTVDTTATAVVFAAETADAAAVTETAAAVAATQTAESTLAVVPTPSPIPIPAPGGGSNLGGWLVGFIVVLVAVGLGYAYYRYKQEKASHEKTRQNYRKEQEAHEDTKRERDEQKEAHEQAKQELDSSERRRKNGFEGILEELKKRARNTDAVKENSQKFKEIFEEVMRLSENTTKKQSEAIHDIFCKFTKADSDTAWQTVLFFAADDTPHSILARDVAALELVKELWRIFYGGDRTEFFKVLYAKFTSFDPVIFKKAANIADTEFERIDETYSAEKDPKDFRGKFQKLLVSYNLLLSVDPESPPESDSYILRPLIDALGQIINFAAFGQAPIYIQEIFQVLDHAAQSTLSQNARPFSGFTLNKGNPDDDRRKFFVGEGKRGGSELADYHILAQALEILNDVRVTPTSVFKQKIEEAKKAMATENLKGKIIPELLALKVVLHNCGKGISNMKGKANLKATLLTDNISFVGKPPEEYQRKIFFRLTNKEDSTTDTGSAKNIKLILKSGKNKIGTSEKIEILLPGDELDAAVTLDENKLKYFSARKTISFTLQAYYDDWQLSRDEEREEPLIRDGVFKNLPQFNRAKSFPDLRDAISQLEPKIIGAEDAYDGLFWDRTEEMNTLEAFHNGEEKVAVIYGPSGFGKTALLSKFKDKFPESIFLTIQSEKVVSAAALKGEYITELVRQFGGSKKSYDQSKSLASLLYDAFGKDDTPQTQTFLIIDSFESLTEILDSDNDTHKNIAKNIDDNLNAFIDEPRCIVKPTPKIIFVSRTSNASLPFEEITQYPSIQIRVEKLKRDEEQKIIKWVKTKFVNKNDTHTFFDEILLRNLVRKADGHPLILQNILKGFFQAAQTKREYLSAGEPVSLVDYKWLDDIWAELNLEQQRILLYLADQESTYTSLLKIQFDLGLKDIDKTNLNRLVHESGLIYNSYDYYWLASKLIARRIQEKPLPDDLKQGG